MQPTDFQDRLLQCFDARSRRSIFLIGGGGKTTLSHCLAKALAARGRKVVLTTTTKIRCPASLPGMPVIVGTDPGILLGALRQAFGGSRQVTAGSQAVDGSKLVGFSVDVLDGLVESGVAHHWIVEADGSRGRPLKAHAPYEPVIGRSAELVIAVIGLDCLGVPLEENFVHRAHRCSGILGKPPGHRIEAQDVVRLVFHPGGYLQRVPPSAAVAVFLSKAGGEGAVRTGRRLARMLRDADRLGRVDALVLGELVGENLFVEAPLTQEP